MERSDDKQLQAILKDLSSFTTRLVNRLHADNSTDNLLISPISIANSLALLLSGATGETYSQIQKVLGLQSFATLDKIKRTFFLLNAHLNTFKSVMIANAVAYHSKEKINSEYHKMLTSTFDAEGFSFNFEKDSPHATTELNRWVSGKTNGKINNFLEEPAATSTRLILFNAVYFKDSWEFPFKESQSHLDRFYYAKNHYSEVRMMEKAGEYDYAEFAEGQLLKIPYKSHYNYSSEDRTKTARMSNCYQLDMFIYLPAENDKPKFNLETIESHIDQMRQANVKLYLPRFKVVSSMSLNQALRSLGVEDAFVAGRADLSPINGRRDLYVSKAMHKTFIEVDEKGTEATATTAFHIVGCMSAPVSPGRKVFRVNRPFMFTIRPHSKVNLFTGIVNKL